jgi:ribosome-binding protein aMBF1 (putative translation factor)
MYNYFADEKKKKDKEQKLSNDYKEKKLREKRQKNILPEFASNYDSRIKNFIFEVNEN